MTMWVNADASYSICLSVTTEPYISADASVGYTRLSLSAHFMCLHYTLSDSIIVLSGVESAQLQLLER